MANRSHSFENAAMDYAVGMELDAPLEVARWRPLVQWVLGIPHIALAVVLGRVGQVVAVISWFAIVFTGRLPEGLANFQCLVIRYQARAFTYALWLYEDYPPFAFAMTPTEPGGSPVRVDLTTELEDRNRLTVGLRLFWLIPIAHYAVVMAIAAIVVGIIGFFAVLFTGRWPEGLRRFLVGVTRLSVRVNAYGSLLVDDYPPFSLN
jgi:hypothetical protein